MWIIGNVYPPSNLTVNGIFACVNTVSVLQIVLA